MATKKKVFTDESLVFFVDEIKSYTNDTVEANKPQELTNEQIDAVCAAYVEDGNGSGTGAGGTSSVYIDTTLTVSGAAADSKTVGDIINSLISRITVLENLISSGDFSNASASVQNNKLTISGDNAASVSNEFLILNGFEDATVQNGVLKI